MDEETLSKLKQLKQQSLTQTADRGYQFQIGDKVAVKSHPHQIGSIGRINLDPTDPKPYDVWFVDRTDWYAQQELERINHSDRVAPTKLKDHQTNCSTHKRVETEQPAPPDTLALDLRLGTCPGVGWLDFPGTGGKATRMNQALQICQQLKQAKLKQDLTSIKVADGWASDAQVNWVRQHLLTASECQHIESMLAQTELNLFAADSDSNMFEAPFESLSTNQMSLLGRWVKLKSSDGLTANQVVGETVSDGVRLIQIELAPGVIAHRYASHVIQVFDQKLGS